MRKLFFIGFVMLFLGSCSVDSATDVNEFRTEFVPIATVEVPETFQLGQSYNIQYTYYRPTNCHVFNDLYTVASQNQTTIAVINTVITGGVESCEPLTNEVESRSFNFAVTNSSTHYFKFWQGQDDSGQDIYLKIEVPVNN